MKLCFTLLMISLTSGTFAFGQINQDMLSLKSIGKLSGQATEGPTAMVCDTLQTLTAGPLDTQIGEGGLDYGADPAVMVLDVGGGDLEINIENTAADGEFATPVFIDVEPIGSPMADDGLTIGFDYSLTDLATDRFYTPQAADEGIIFTRFGDATNNGVWDVLVSDGMGNGLFVDTGVPIALSGRVEIVINNLDMEITVDGANIFTGQIVAALGDPGFTPGERPY